MEIKGIFKTRMDTIRKVADEALQEMGGQFDPSSFSQTVSFLDSVSARIYGQHDCDIENGHEGACEHPSHPDELDDFRVTEDDLT